MGTQSSKSINDFSDLQSMVLQQAVNIKDLAMLTHDDLLANVNSLNQIIKTMQNREQRLVFAVQRGSDSTLFWKATIRIACVKADGTSNKIESGRLLTLKQFIQFYKTVMYQFSASQGATGNSSNSNGASSSAGKSTLDEKQTSYSSCSAQMDADILKVLDDEWPQEKSDECCICMDRKPDIILPCTHSYCLVCIENWNVSHKTCPVCRETVENTDDSWVISEAPDSEEMTSEMKKFLASLVYKKEDAT